MQIAGKLFVITGAGNGMARETALQLLAKDARVAGVDLSADGLAETKELAAPPSPGRPKPPSRSKRSRR